MTELNNAMQDRSHRLNSIVSTTTASAAAKGIAALVQLALVPITLGYLGQSSYGIWMTISATIAFLQVSDLGVGNALISLTAKQRIEGGSDAVTHLLKQGLLISSSISALVFLVGLIIINNTNWVELLAIPAAQETEACDAMVACLVMFCVSMPLALAQQVRLGLMQGYGNSIFQSMGHLLNLIFVWLGVKQGVGLPMLIVLSTLGILIGNLANLIFLLRSTSGIKISADKNAERAKLTIGTVIARGAPFLVLQIAGLLVYQSDVLIISHFLGPESVTDYAVSMKYFSIPILILGFYLYSLWPAYADAQARGDWFWIRNFYRGSLRNSILFSCTMAIIFLMAAFWLLPFWTKGKVGAEPLLVALLAIHVGLNAIGGNLATFMNGLHMLKLQTILAVIGALVTIWLSIVLTPRIGLSGPIAAIVFTNAIMYLIMFQSVKKKLNLTLQVIKV